MTFEEAVDFLRQQQGRTIEISICLPSSDAEERRVLATVTGSVNRVVAGGGMVAEAVGDLWRVWFESDHGDQVTLRRDLFESAEVVADQPPAEERNDGEHGTTWTLTIHQAGLIFDVLIYV